jgi:excisionase family DNA binding protein
MHSELTTSQAAELLNVSEAFLIEQLERSIIPHTKAGTHRQILFKDLMAYKKRVDRDRLSALEELSAVDQELGLGYGE